MNKAERALSLLLRLVGVVCLFATFAVFMPLRWMAVVHDWLGLGQLPQGRVVEYLARSLSAFYALMGGLLVFLSFDVRRYSGVIAYLAVASLLFAPMILVVDLSIGMPLHWTLQEGPFVLLMGVAILLLQWRARVQG